jgi:NitT/TauT family transport system ATP-binding protein
VRAALLTIWGQETLAVPLPHPRDQVTTKELPEFVQLRGHVYRAIKRTPAPALS